MTAPLAFPLVNGTRHGFASVELAFQFGAGQKIQVFCHAINYVRTRNRGLVRGNHPDPIAKTLGENEYSADLEIYLAEWQMLQDTLGPGYGDKLFSMFVTYGENGFDTKTDEIKGASFDSTEANNAQGPDPLMRKMNLNPLKILFAGQDDLANPLKSPTQ